MFRWLFPWLDKPAWRRLVLLSCTAATLGAAGSAQADYIVPANAVATLNGALLDLACTDLVVGGTLLLNGAGINNVRNITIQPGGILDTTGGVILLGGNWTNDGTFVHGGGSVLFRDACSTTTASITGKNVLGDASFVSSIGRTYVFAASSTQVVAGLLEIVGVGGAPIQFRSTVPGQPAFLDLRPAGTQQIQHVGVDDVQATGQWLAPDQHNEGGGANAVRWFGAGDGVQVIPTLGSTALALLATLLAGAGAWLARRRRGAPVIGEARGT